MAKLFTKKLVILIVSISFIFVLSCNQDGPTYTSGAGDGTSPSNPGGSSGGGGGGSTQVITAMYTIPDNFKDNLNKTDGISVWNTPANGQQSDELGRTYSKKLATTPKADGYATVGSTTASAQDNQGSFRIPSVIKTKLDNGNTRLITAFDVRYRGSWQGSGDVGQNNAGSDITVMYSDDGGNTWHIATNKKTGTKPAIDVENTYDGDGNTKTQSPTNTLDVCDPQLVDLGNGLIYLGAAAGTGNLQSFSAPNWRVFKSSDYGATWEESSKSSANQTLNDKFFRNWKPSNTPTGFKTQITCPGHGITLTKDVPNNDKLTKDTTVLPLFYNADKWYVYLASGQNGLENWNTFSPATQHNTTGIGEAQICQLDDGSLFMLSNTNSAGVFSKYAESWTSYTSVDNKFKGPKGGQMGLLKVSDGNGNKSGVVAFSYSGNAASNTGFDKNGGRGNITIAFAKDKSSTLKGSNDFPLDDTAVYYLKVRTPGQNYFGYTDLVMVDDDTIGILYENYSGTDAIDGMRFLTVNVKAIIDELSKN